MNILYEDHDLLVVDKPSGITVNRSETTRNEQTVQDEAQEYLKIPKELPTEGDELDSDEYGLENKKAFYRRSGIVHRIDKETSGILLIAKNTDSFLDLLKQFKERAVRKTYIALVHGNISPESGEVNVPIGRQEWNRKRFGVVPGGKESMTIYKTRGVYESDKNKERFTLLELTPKSGRTHQIRVHMKYLNHPVFSDFLYAGRKTARNDRKILPRVFLHAAGISFKHPVKQEVLSLTSNLPEELQNVLERKMKKIL